MTIHVRRLTAADAGEYHELRVRGLREHPDAFTSSYEEDREKPLDWARSRLATAHNIVLGAFADGQLVGILGMSVDPRAKVRHKAELGSSSSTLR